MSNSSQAIYSPFQPPTFDLQQTQSTQSGPISPALSSKVAQAVGLSEQTFAPESTLQSFQNAAPNLNSVQPMLVGSGFGSQSDWSQVSSTKSVGSLQLNNSNSSQQVSSIATGGFASALMPKQSSSQTATPVASVLSAEQYRGMQSQTVTGSYCTQDGRVVIVPRLGEGEPPADGSGNGGADDEPFIPQVDVPDLQSANGSLNSFTPSDASGSSTTMTLHGSFTAGSLTNPDFNADGINWVHVVTTNWIDENTWSFTETLILSYNLSASDSSSSDDEEDNAGSGGGSGDSSSNNGPGSNGSSSGSGSGSSGGSEDPEDELQVTSNWSSTASATRNGFIMYAFTASRGIASPSAAGVAWSVGISYSDRIHFELSANGGSSYTLGVPAGSGTGSCGTACHDSGNSNSGSNSGGPSGGGDGDGGDTDLPDNFKASANWDFSIGLDAHSNGTVNVSSTPLLAIATGIFGGIDRAISANITYDSGGAADVGSNWSSSSSSGNLQPDHENPGDPCITCGGDSNAGSGGDPNSPPPLNPRGNFIGSGHMSASSGGSTGHTGGRSIGGLGALGTLNNSKWKNLVGDVHDNFHADAHGDGQAKHGFVFQQDTTVTPVADGTNTTKVIVAYGWDSAGDDTATLDADGSVQLGVKPDGDADTSDSTGKAELDGNGNGNGHDFMRIIASDVTNRAWDRQNQLGPTGEVFNEMGHRNFGDYLNYNSYNEGKGRDTFHSAVNGSLQPTGNATFKIDASGNSFLRVASDNEFAKHTTAWRSDTPVVWLGNSQGNDAQFTELTNDYTVNGLITATLQSDESVVLSGGAHANDKSKIKYRNHNESTWDTNLASGDSLRDAKFDATGTFDANYNAATDTYSESYSKSGDDEVQVTGHVTHIGPVTVGAVGAIGDDPPSIGAMAKTEYELLLEGIFADYDEDGGTAGGMGSGEGESLTKSYVEAGDRELVGEGEDKGDGHGKVHIQIHYYLPSLAPYSHKGNSKGLSAATRQEVVDQLRKVLEPHTNELAFGFKAYETESDFLDMARYGGARWGNGRYDFMVCENPKLAGLGPGVVAQGANYQGQINAAAFEKQWPKALLAPGVSNKAKRDIVLGGTILHELLFHTFSTLPIRQKDGTYEAHPDATGFIDSKLPVFGGGFSERAAGLIKSGCGQ